MLHMAPLDNRVQEYAWGSHTAIAELLGKARSDRPQAELWMGAHPAAPSIIDEQGRRLSLLEAIAASPEACLGARALDRFGPRLPFLLKVLAADRPLSLQAHPDEPQARRGYEAENQRGLPLDAPERTYRDPHHKPELICALTPFDALCGFRPAGPMRAALELIAAGPVEPMARAIRAREHIGASDLSPLVSALMRLGEADRAALVGRVVEACRAKASSPGDALSRACGWALRLNELYPGDIGVVVALMLNDVHLEPGQALYLPPRRLHAYVQGVGIEIMASSDNVLRGGLTPKRIDVDELLRVLDFTPSAAEPLAPSRQGTSGELVYETSAPEFRLSRVDLAPAEPDFTAGERLGPEILLCTRGRASLTGEHGARLELERGGSVFIPHAAGSYRARGEGTLFRATLGAPGLTPA